MNPADLAEKALIGAAKAAATAAAKQIVPRIAPTAKERKAVIRGAVTLGKTAITKIGSGVAAAGGTLAGAGAGAVAGVAAAGIAAFLAGSYVKGLVQDAIFARVLKKAGADNIARANLNEANFLFVKAIGRDPSPAEAAILYDQFFGAGAAAALLKNRRK